MREKLDGLSEQELRRVVLKLAYGIQRRARENIVRNGTTFSGDLSRSIRVIENRDGTVFVGSDLPYAPCIEFGSLPHMPPVEPLRKWCRLKLGVSRNEAEECAWAVAMKIKKEGCKPQPFFRPALDEADRILKNVLG